MDEINNKTGITNNNICPITGLTTLSLPEYENLHMKGDYFISLKKIGDSIVYIAAIGSFKFYEVEQFNNVIDEFCSKAGVQKPYIQIRDASKLNGRIPLKTLRQQSRSFLNQQNTLAAVVTIDDPLWLKLFIKHGVRIFSPKVKFESAKSYASALEVSQKLIKSIKNPIVNHKPQLPSKALSFEDVIFQPQWEYCNEQTGFTYKIGIIEGTLLFNVVIGSMKTMVDIEQTAALVRKVATEHPLLENSYIVIDLSRVSAKTPLALQKAFAKKLKGLWSAPQEENVLHILISNQKWFKVAGKLFFSLLKQKLTVASSMEEAFFIINALQLKKEESPLLSQGFSNVSAENIQEIVDLCSGILWDETEEEFRIQTSADNPLLEIAEMLSLIKTDLSEQKKIEKEKNEERLKESETNRQYLQAMVEEAQAAKEALIKTKAEMRAIIENTLDNIWSVNTNYEIIYINEVFVQAFFMSFGVKLESGSKILEAVSEKIKPLWKERYDRAFKGERFVFEDEINVPGSVIYIEVAANPIFNDGKVVGASMFGQDITDKKRSEEALKKSQELHQAFNNASEDIIFIKNEKLQYVVVNNASTKFFSKNREEIIGKTDTELADNSLILPCASSDRKALELGQTITVEEKLGDRFYETTKFPVSLASNKIGIGGIIRDITHKKESEENSQKLEIAQKTVQFKQNFLANMSHEIRTPLTGVLGMIEILEHTPLNDHQKDYIDTLKSSGKHLREIIDQVLDFSKIEAGKIILKPTVFNLRDLVHDSMVLFRSGVKTGVVFSEHIDSELPLIIEADKFRLSQVLNNIISNAIKFTAKGEVSVYVYPISFDKKANKCVLKFEVKDTGNGIPELMQDKLFTPFAQIEMVDTRQYEGTGLGLSICKELVELMGGELGVKSKEGKGSTFWFSFPAKVADNKSYKNHTDTKTESPKLKVLFAEDKIVNQKVIKLMLSSMGHEIAIANNGKEALEMYEEGKYDLILMDIQMPVMDGVTATQQLKDKHANLPPIVGLSANAFEGDKEKYMAAGLDDYLTKPIKKEELMGLMERIKV